MSIYKDIGFDFIKEPQEGSSSVNDIESINQSIKNILFTHKGEVPFDPLFGSGIRNLLFEKISPITEHLLKDEIIFALRNHEPRIVINKISIESNYDSNAYHLQINYTVILLDQEGQLDIDLKLQGI